MPPCARETLDALPRRRFLERTAAASAGLALGSAPLARALGRFEVPARAPGRLVGIQIAPQNLLDEGIDRCLDTLQETGRINSLFLLSHGYYGSGARPPAALADDHGVPVRDERDRRFPRVWVRHHDRFFGDTSLRHRQGETGVEYADQDLFATLREPLSQRGMKLYARFYEPYDLAPRNPDGLDALPGFREVRTVDVNGQPGLGPCWNNPDYRAFLVGTVRDLFTTYDLDGLQFGSETTGPLSMLLYRGTPPFCFCAHCLERNRARGIDPDRAREGYLELTALIGTGETPPPVPVDGLMTSLLRTMMHRPEVLSWNVAWHAAELEILAAMYGAAKEIAPGADVGWHIDHQRSSWDLIYRASVSYAEFAENADFVKPILYHDVLGPRLRRWVLDDWKRHALRELPLEPMLAAFYAFHGLDPSHEPDLDELETTGLSTGYVRRETRRTVEGVAGEARVYAGIGIDIPWNGARFPSPPESVYEATRAALEAGADGILASRHYDEMRLPALRALGRALG